MIIKNIEDLADENTNFRKVIYTDPHCQITVMSLPVGTNIGIENHEDVEQLFFIVDGKGEALIGSELEQFEEDDMLHIPSGTDHDIRNTGDEDLKLISIYSKPVHPEGLIQKTS